MRKKSSKYQIMHLFIDFSLIILMQQFQNETSVLIHIINLLINLGILFFQQPYFQSEIITFDIYLSLQILLSQIGTTIYLLFNSEKIQNLMVFYYFFVIPFSIKLTQKIIQYIQQKMLSKFNQKLDKKSFTKNDQKYLDWFMRKTISDIRQINKRNNFNENSLELYEVKILDQILRCNRYLNDISNNLEPNQQNSHKQIDRENLQEQLKFLISQLYLTGETHNSQEVREFLISHLVFLINVQKNYALFTFKAYTYQKNFNKKQKQIVFTLLNECQNQIDLQIYKHKNDSIYEKSIMSVIIYDDQINQIEVLIEEAVLQKLNILFTMNQKYINLQQLQSQLNLFQIKRRQIISLIQNITQMNFLNIKLQNLITIYLKTIAFTEKDIKLNNKNTKVNQYYNKIFNQYATNEEACVIISQFNNEQEQIIKNVSHNFKRVFNGSQDDYLGQSISKLMPEPYSRVHQNYVEKYINTQNSTAITSSCLLAFALTQNQYIIPIQLELKFNTSLDFQLNTEVGFALYLQKINKQKEYILYNKNNFEIVSITEQIHQNIFYGYQDYTRINLLQFFPIIYKASNQMQKQSQLYSKALPILHIKYESSKYKQQKILAYSQKKYIQMQNFHKDLSKNKSLKLIQSIQRQEEIHSQIELEAQKQLTNQPRAYQSVEEQLIEQHLDNQIGRENIDDILKIKYLLVLQNQQKSLMSQQKNLNPQQINQQKNELFYFYQFYVLQFNIKSVKSEYLTHLKYIEISKQQKLNPIKSASLILSFYKNSYKRTSLSNIDQFYDQQLESLFQDLESMQQLKNHICDQEVVQTPDPYSQQQSNSSSQNNNTKLNTQQAQDYLGNKKYKIDEFNQNSFNNNNNNNINNPLVNLSSFDIKECAQNFEQPLIKLATDQNVQQFENLTHQNSSLISQNKSQIALFQFRGKNIDSSIDNLSQTQRFHFCNTFYLDNQSSQISDRILKNHSNSMLTKQDLNISQTKLNSQLKLNFNNSDLINSIESDSYVNQFQNNIINLNTQSQTQIQTSQSLTKNVNQQTLQKLIFQNQNKIQSKKNDLNIQQYEQQKQINNLLKLKQIFNGANNQDSASNSSKCSSSSNIKYIERKILSEKRQLAIQFVNLFGFLSLIILSVVIIQQFFSINLLFENFQSELNIIGWPTDYMDSLSLIVKNSNLQKLLQHDYIQIKGGDVIKQTMKNQSQQEIVFAINQIKNLTNQMEKNANSLQIFKNILEKPNVFRFGANYNPKIPLNIQPADTYYQLIDIEMGLFYSLELIILYLFRFAYGLGLGSGQFITLSNKLPISKQLSTITQQNISEMVDQISSIQENLLSILVTMIVVVFCSIFLTLPLYSIIQIKKQKLLQLFSTFHSDMISIEINKIEDCVVQNFSKQLKNVKYLINQQMMQQKNLNLEKKQSISSTSQLQKFNFKIILLATIIFIITLPYPIIIQSLCKDYISQSKAVLQTIKSLYEMQQHVIENTGIHYFCIYLRISPSTAPYSYINNRQEVYQNLITANIQKANLYQSLINLKATKLYNRSQFDQFFFRIFESDICQIMKNNMNLFVSGFQYNSEECQQIYNGRFSQGLTIALQQYFSYFPDLYQIYEISDQNLFQQTFDKYQKNLDFEQFYKLEKYLVVILKTLSKFILDQTNQYENYLLDTMIYLLIVQILLFGMLFYFGQRKFLKMIETELNETKQYLSLLNINFLLQNTYIQNFLQKHI
ncbi:transmembrane protein, putative (macronuclear) [Tetrahymena thermophila SB210]|uniref:Transmembrane protein, putative n=1 Tax=Tetrahymena thermophila (strain SB210) TaxID=312017 RepID=I7MIF4_TETTS|nr:transmembrane protein, putative [Tetrahymena thermophila SB210]EAS04343.2 transmembrane protein, putative [Tetrahymena thermophila SB210]|eukprot:XP_001024588.2 transmembrane protein, putative [Tetrahymena thermophila SB210]